MKISSIFSRIPYKKYLAGFLISTLLISQTIHVDFFDRAEAGPENYRDIVSIIVDEDTYRSERNRILRYADDIAGYLGGVRTSIFVVDKDTPVASIVTKNEKLYYEGDGEAGTSYLVGTVLIGNIPIPMVEKDGTNFPSVFPYVDFVDKIFVYDGANSQYSYNQENDGVEEADIWHGVISPATGRSWSGASDIQKIGQFLDKTHEFYIKSGKFTLSTIPPKVFYYDGHSEGKSISPRALFQYSLYVANIENMAYSRYTKHLLRDISKVLADFDKKTEDPEVASMFAELGLSSGDDTLSEEQIKKLPDIQSKNVILGFLKNFKGIFNEKTLGDELLSVHNAGRYTSGATVRADLAPVSISLMDEVARSILYEANTALEKKIDALLVDNKYARRIPIFDEIRYASGYPLDWNSAHTNILQNYAFGQRSTNIKEPLDCTIARGNTGDIVQYGRAELVEANVAFDILKTESQINTLKTDTDMLIGMGKSNCFPGSKPRIDSYWGGNSILRVAAGGGDPTEVLDKFPAVTTFKGFTAPIFSLQGMKETDRLTTGSVKDCLKSPYQYVMQPARAMTDTDAVTGNTCSTAYPSEWTNGLCSRVGGAPRFTCISSVSHSGTTFDFESAVDEFKGNGKAKYYSNVGIFGSSITGDCHNGKLTLDGTAIFTKNNICTITYEAYDGSGNVMAGDTIDITDYKDMDFHTIPSLMKHVSPTNEELNAAQSSGITPSIPVDMVRYVEFYTPKGNVARINYPNFFDIPSHDVASARVWLKNQADTEWQKIINTENATSNSAKYTKANGYLSAGVLPASPVNWNDYVSDEMLLKIIQARHWLHPDISLKYRQSIEAMLSYSHENTLVTSLEYTPPKIPTSSHEYEIAYLGLPDSFAADFSQATYSNSMAEYEAKLREIEGVNITDESKADSASSGGNSAAECGPPDGVPLFQWPSAIMCWIKAQFPPKILAGSCTPTTIGLDSSNGKTQEAPPEKIAQDPNALTNFYVGSKVMAHLPRSNMNLRDSITVDLSLQKDNKILTTLPDTIAHLEIENVSVGGKNIEASLLGNYIQISPENSIVGEKGASFILESQGKPATVTLRGYFSQPLPGGSELRIDSGEFNVEITPEYYTFSLFQSGASIANIDATSAEPVTLRIQKVLEDESEVTVKTPVKVQIFDDVDGSLIYSGASFNPSVDTLPTSITKKVGVYRFIAEDNSGISGEFTFAVEAGTLSQIRIVPISSALVRGTRTLADIRLLDRLGNPASPDVHNLKIDITGGYLVDGNGEKRTTMSMDIMESQIPVIIGSDSSGTLNLSATLDENLFSGSKDITIYNSARIVLKRDSSPRVGGDPVGAHIEIQDDSGNKMAGLSSVASWKFPDGAGSFSKEAITITDGVSEDFNYLPGTIAGDHALSIDIPGIGSLSDIVFSLLPGDPMYISHTKDNENIIFSLRDRYGNIASLHTLAGTLTRNVEIPQAIIFSNGVYTMPIVGGYYTVDVPSLKNYSISYTDEYGKHDVYGVDRYVAYIVGNDEKVRFAPDYNARYTVLAGGSFLREGEDILYNVTPGLSQSLAVSTVLDSPYQEEVLASILPGGSYKIGTTAEDVALESNVSLSQGFPLLTISDLVTRKQVTRVLYHMQNASLEMCQETKETSCYTSKKSPTIRLILPQNSEFNTSIIQDKLLLNSQGTNIFSVQNDGYINSLPGITLVPKDSNTLGFGMSVMQDDKEIATLLYITDESLSVERASTTTTQTPRNTPVILSSGFSIEKMNGKVFGSDILGYKIYRSATTKELDESKNGPSGSDSIGSLSEAPGVGWTGNNTMLLAYAAGDTVGESTRFFHTYTLVNLGDPVAHIDHGRPGTEIDGIDRTVGSIIARGTRSGIANFFHRDMNADGNTDLIVLYQDGFVELFLNLGGKFRSRGMIAYNKDIGTSQLEFADFTHDGFADIIGVNKEGSLILVDNSERKFSRPNITLDGGAPVPRYISQFRIYDMDSDTLDDIVYITASGELGILYGTTTVGNFTKKVLDPTLGISLSEDPITTGGAIKASNTPQYTGPLGVNPIENTGSVDDTMLKDEVYYQFTYPEPEISETTDAATLSGMFDDIGNGKTGQKQYTFTKSQYAPGHGLEIEKKYTNTTHSTLYPDDLIQAKISIKNTTNRTITDVEYLDVVPKIFSIDNTEKYTVSIGGTSIDRTFNSLAVGDYDMYFIGRDIPPGQTLEISYDMVALPASYGEMVVGDLEKNTVGSDVYGDVGFKTSTTCGASMLLWTSGPGSRDYTKGTHEFGTADLPAGLDTQLADSDGNSLPDSIENIPLADRQSTYNQMTTSNSENKPLVKVSQSNGSMTIGFDSESEDAIIDATQNLLDGLACGFGGGSCMSFPMNWAPLAPGSDPVMFGKLQGDGLIIDEGLPIFSALTRMDFQYGPVCVTIPSVWPISPYSINANGCSMPTWIGSYAEAAAAIAAQDSSVGQNIGAGGVLGTDAAGNFLRIFVTPTLTMGVGTAICLGGPADSMGDIPPSGLSPLVQGGNCIVMTKPMAVCKGDGSIADGNVAPISGLGTLTDTWNASSCKPKVSGGTESENQVITNDIVKYLKNPDTNKLQSIYANMSRRGAQNSSYGPLLRVGNTSGGSNVEIDIDSNTKVSDISKVVKLKNIRIPAFPDFIMDWLTRQTEEIVTSLFTPPNLTIIPPTDFGQNAQVDSGFDGITKKLGNLYSQANVDNIKQGVGDITSGKKPNTTAMASDAKGTLNTIKSAYTLIGKLPFIKIHQVRIPFNIPWIQMSELDKYGRALDGYMKEFDKAMKNFCVSDPSAACLDTKAKLQSGPFVNSIRENIKRIEEYKRFPTKVLKYITWKERYISQILCNINTIQQITGGWLRDNGIRFRKWAELFVLIKSIADGWQPLLDIFNDTSVSCGVCRNERGNAQSWKFKLISALLPSIPVITFPKWPDIILDLSDIRFAITFGMPNLDPRISPIRLPNLPNLSIGGFSAGLSLPPLPILPALPPLPDMPDLPSLPKIKLPDLPPPPKLPKLAGGLQAFLKVLKLISKMYCYYQKTVLIPEWQVGDVIAQRTERQATSIFDFLTLQTPQFTLPTLKEIRLATHVNFELKSDFITEFTRSAVRPVNKFGTDLQNVLPKKIGEDVGIQSTKINLNKQIPYHINPEIEKKAGMISQLVSEMENEKDVYLEVEDFAQYLLTELDSPEFSEVAISLKRELAVAKIESEKIQDDLIVYNNKKFDLLRDYLSAENDNTAQLRNIVDLLNSDVSDEPRQLISDMANASIRSTKLLQKYEDFQNSSIDATKNDFGADISLESTKKSLQGKLARMLTATSGGGSAATSVAEGYSPNYQGVYIRTPSGVQTQLFDYIGPLTEDTRVDTIDIDKDGDMDYLYLLDGVLYVKYTWQYTPNKIQDLSTKISEIHKDDLVPYVPDYFHENLSTPKDLNFSFVPSSQNETEWRVDFFDRYIEWDYLDIGNHDPKKTPKTTIDMFLAIEKTPISGSPISSTRITRSLKSVQDTGSFVLQGRNIEIYTGALSISLSPGRVLYTGKDSVNITYQDINMSGSQSISLDPYTGYEFDDITEITTSNGKLYLIGAEDNSRYEYSDDFIGMPILPGMQMYASDGGAMIHDHTSGGDLTLLDGVTYITYDLGDRDKGYEVSVPYANGYYYSRLQNLTTKKMDRAGIILFAPQASSDDGAPLVDLPSRIRLPIYSKKTFKIADILTDLSDATLSIDSDIGIDSDGNGIYEDDFSLSGTGFSISQYDLEFGQFTTPGIYEMTIQAIDEMNNVTVMPFEVEAYTPVPKIQNVTSIGNIEGSISEAVGDTPVHFFRVRSGEVPNILSKALTPTDNLGGFLTGSFYNNSESINLKTASNTLSIDSHGVLTLPNGYSVDILPATENNSMEILSIDPSGSVSHRHTLALPDDVIFTDISKGSPTTSTGISITPITTNVVLASSTDVSIPGGAYITNSSHIPLAAMARDGNIYVLDTGITLKYGVKNGYITIDLVRENTSIASIEYRINFFYTAK